MMKKHREAYEQFVSTFPSETIQKWTIMVEDWKKDHTKPSPYAEPENSKRSPRSRAVILIMKQ